jgi:hypothetical protein
MRNSRRSAAYNRKAPQCPAYHASCFVADSLRRRRRSIIGEIGGCRNCSAQPRPRADPTFARDNFVGGAVSGKALRVLTKDRPENRGFFDEGFDVVMEVMVGSQGEINHFFDL